MRKVVITGMGVVSPLGSTVESFWERLKAGRSGVRLIDRFDVSQFATKIAAQVIEFNPDLYIPKKEQRRMDLYSRYAMAAAHQAITSSGLQLDKENPERLGVLVSSGIGGLETLEEQSRILLEKGPSRCSPFMIPQMIANMAGGLIAIRYNMKGPNYAIVSACASALHSMGDALRIIQRGEADVMLAGGSEASLTPLGLAGFSNMRAISERNDEPEKASRPFDLNRDGFVMGEGAACLLLEELEHARRRGADIWCEVAGFGMTCDAYHMTAPDETAMGPARAVQLALQDAGIEPAAVDYINAHGTSTPLNDKTETKAIKIALGEDVARKVMVSSTKSMTGHLLGAAGGIESVACVLAIRYGVVPPTINYETPDPECDLDYVPNTAREARINVCMNNSFGFGGHNACVVFRRI